MTHRLSLRSMVCAFVCVGLWLTLCFVKTTFVQDLSVPAVTAAANGAERIAFLTTVANASELAAAVLAHDSFLKGKAPGSIVAAFGAGMTTATQAAGSVPLPT